MFEIASKTAVWYSSGLPAVPVRWVLIRDPQGEFKTQALLCADLDAEPQEILSWFVMCWQLEVTFSWTWKGRWTTRMLKAGSSKMDAHFLLPPMSLGVVEIFLILVVVGLAVYVLWRC